MSVTIPSYQENLKGLVEQLGGMLPPDKLEVFDHDANTLAKNHPQPLKFAVGDAAPLFELPNAKGETISLRHMLSQGPVVLVFYRGVWCPYCNLELKLYQQILPEIKSLGANLIAISPMNKDSSLSMKETNELGFEILSDINNTVSNQYTTVFKNPETSITAMSDLGYDFHSFYDDNSAELPVPSVFVIGRDGKILLSESAGGDYRNRVEPQAILDSLK